MSALRPLAPRRSRRPAVAISPVGLKPPPKHAPTRLKSTEDLRALQRLMTHLVIRPLTADNRMQARWIDGRSTAQVAGEFIKPNDRLTSFERLQLYNRMYWFRLIDCVYDDNPGLRAWLGERKFSQLTEAFLTKYPSRSFTLRDLCSRLEQFLGEEPRWAGPRPVLARQIARFEWAQTVAFDGEARPVLSRAEIAAVPPGRLRLGLQPYLSLLALDYAIDDYVIAIKQREALRGEASHAVDRENVSAAKAKRASPPRRERIYLAMHRYNNRLYYKRLDAAAFKMLEALQRGRTLTQAVTVAGKIAPEQARDWFATWMELGWFCRRKAAKERPIPGRGAS